MEFSTLLLDTSLQLSLNASPEESQSPTSKTLPSQGLYSDSWDSCVDERGGLKDRLKKLSEENQKLTRLLNAMQENCNNLSRQLREQTPVSIHSPDRKRKAEPSVITKEDLAFCGETSSSDKGGSTKKPRDQHEVVSPTISRVFVRTDASDTSLIVKDEYKWRKYGQKVTKDNPCPKAYFRCGSSPNCLVKKKVQRSMEDQSIVVATYEGEHNHPPATNPHEGAPKCTSSSPSTFQLTASKHKMSQGESASLNAAAPEGQKLFMEKMASTLAKDASFRDALAAAISERFLVHSNHK